MDTRPLNERLDSIGYRGCVGVYFESHDDGTFSILTPPYRPCQKCKQLQHEIGQLLAELVKADSVINKQQAEIAQLRQQLEAKCEHCAVVEDAYDRGVKVGHKQRIGG